MEFSEIVLWVLQGLSPLLLAALTWMAAKVAAFIRAKVDHAYLQGVLIRLDDAVVSVVKDLQQTVVRESKALSEDGKLSVAERRRIKKVAVNTLKSYIGGKGIALLTNVLGLTDGAVDGLLGAKIEAAVHDLRLAERVVTDPSRSRRRPRRPFSSAPT